MDKVRAVIVVGAADEDDLWDATVSLFGKDAANLWEFVGDETYSSTDTPSGAIYDTLVGLFPANGADTDNPFE